MQPHVVDEPTVAVDELPLSAAHVLAPSQPRVLQVSRVSGGRQHVGQVGEQVPSAHQHAVNVGHVTKVIPKIIISMMNFCGAYILRYLSSEAYQTKTIFYNREQGRAEVTTRTRDHRRFIK